MKDLSTPFKVGLLVIAGIAATIFVLTQLTGDGLGGEDDRIKVYALFDDVTGLAERSRIRTAGIAVGEIASISRQGNKARVEMLIDEDLTLYEGIAPEREGGVWVNGASVSIRSASVIGDSFLEVSPGNDGERIVAEGQIHNVDEGTNLEEIFGTLERITKDIEEVTGSLAAVFGGEEGQRGLEQILRDLQLVLREVSDFVVSGTDKLEIILSDGKVISSNVKELAQNANQSFDEILFEAKGVVRDAKVITRNVRDIVGQSSGDVQAGIGSLSGTVIRLQSTLDSLNYSLQNIQDITDKVNEGEGTIGILVNDPEIADKTNAILGDVREVSGTVGRLRTIVELRSEYHPLFGAFKNVVGLRLQPRRNKYYLLEFVDDFRFDSSYEIQQIQTSDGSEEPVVVETSTDSFRFSVQYALGWNFAEEWIAFGRFGIIESTGGIGITVDRDFSRGRKLRLHGELFDFDIEGQYSPRIRLWADYHFADNFRVIGGFDDILNAPPRFGEELSTLEQEFNGLSPFVSIGFIFTDEDLKGLLTVTGAPTP